MGTNDSASNPVACLRSNCVPFGGPTSFNNTASSCIAESRNRIRAGETTELNPNQSSDREPDRPGSRQELDQEPWLRSAAMVRSLGRLPETLEAEPEKLTAASLHQGWD